MSTRDHETTSVPGVDVVGVDGKSFAAAVERRQHRNDSRRAADQAWSVQSTREMLSRSASSFDSGMIEFICDAHDPEEDGPTVTPLRVGWGYCPGAGGGRHTWRQIEPATRERVERYTLGRPKPIT